MIFQRRCVRCVANRGARHRWKNTNVDENGQSARISATLGIGEAIFGRVLIVGFNYSFALILPGLVRVVQCPVVTVAITPYPRRWVTSAFQHEQPAEYHVVFLCKHHLLRRVPIA